MKNPEEEKASRSLEWAIENRRTIREITGGQISLKVVDRLVRAACGNTHTEGRVRMRSAPSAGATYPVEVYAALERVDGLPDGIYRYDYSREKLTLKKKGLFLESICRVSLDQDFIPLSNIAFLMVYNPKKIQAHYGRESRKYAILECGHIAQNILLMAASLGLGNVPVGAFYQKRLSSILGIEKDREIIYIICIGIID